MNRQKSTQDWGIAILRMAVGAVFVAHGAQKLFVYGIPGVAGLLGQIGLPFPTLSAAALTAAEFLGGLALLLGFFTRLAALPIAFSMLVAAVSVHLKHGFFLPEGAEYVLVLLGASLALSLTGSGACSIDRWQEGRRSNRSQTSSPARSPEGALRG